MISPSTPSPLLSLQTFEPLLPAERLLLRAAADGAIAKVGYRRQVDGAPATQVRAEFLAFLALGGGAGAAVAGDRLQVLGATIVGRLDLSQRRVPLSLWLYRCLFTAAPRFDGAHLAGSLSVPDCELPGLHAEGARIDGDLELNAGCSARGELVLTRARIGRDLNCERLHLYTDTSTADPLPGRLLADALQVGGHVILTGGVHAVGELNFARACIRGDLRASGARLNAVLDAAGLRGPALVLDRARIGGHVLLDAGFSAAGQVRAQRARIGGDLDCNGADFDVVGDAGWGDAAAVLLDRADIGGSLNLQRLQRPLEGASLVDARVGMLLDDAQSWGSQHALDGFAYRRFDPAAPSDPAMRLAWLVGQRSPRGLAASQQPEPWRRAIKVLRRMGRDDSAVCLAIGRERHLRRSGQIGVGTPSALRWLPRLGHALFGAFTGYGHRPMRLVAAAGVLWVACAGAYWTAADAGAMVPTVQAAPARTTAPRLAPSAARHAGAAPATATPGDAPRLDPLAYSLDVLLPLVDLHQQRRWAPAITDDAPASPAALVQLLAWFEALCGWLAVLTLAAIASGVTDRDRLRR